MPTLAEAKAYNAGRKAFAEGAPYSDQPDYQGSERQWEKMAWSDGWVSGDREQIKEDRHNVLVWLSDAIPGIKLSYEGIDALATMLIVNMGYDRHAPIPLQFGPLKLVCPSPVALIALPKLRAMLKAQPELFIEYGADLGELGSTSYVTVYRFADDADNAPVNCSLLVADALGLSTDSTGDDASMIVPNADGSGVDVAMERLFSLLGLSPRYRSI